MKILTTIVTALLLIQNVARAEEPWRFLTLADWHLAEIYVQPDKYPEGIATVADGLKMLKEDYGGELVMLPGDSNVGHWDTKQFIRSFNPKLTPAESILQAGELCYSGMVDAFNEAGYSRLLMAVGDHELGDNPWPPGTAVSQCQPQFREAFASVFNTNSDNGQFVYDKPIGEAASRPLGTKYETTSFAYQYKNVLFVTVDVFHQEDPDKSIGLQGSVTGAVVGKHLKWLDHVLSEAHKDSSIKHIFVQAHLPVLQPVRRVNSSGMLMDDEMESDFWKTLRKHKVDIYFAGEVHSNTVTKDPKSELIQVVTRAKFMNNFVTVDVTDERIEITLYNQAAPKPSDGRYDVYGKFVIDKSSGRKVFQDEGELTFLDRDARMIHFDFEENFALADRQVLGLQRGPGNPFVSEVAIQGVRCDRSFPNRGVFGQNYDAQYANIALAEGPRGKAGVFIPNSQMAVYGAGPHGHGNIISYALWMKTTSEKDMVLINTGRARLQGLLNHHLNNGQPELLNAANARLIATGQKLNDGKWHHVAVSMPKKDCKLSEVQFYVDGQAVESKVVGQDKRISVSLANKITIGGLGHGNGKTPYSKLIHGELGIKPFVGLLDEVSVCARALTAAEVAELAEIGNSDMEKAKLTTVKGLKAIGRNRLNVTTRWGSRPRWRIWLHLLAYLAVSLPVFGAEVNLPVAKDLSSHGVTQADLEGLDAIMLDAIKEGTITGCSYLVAHKGEVVYRKAHGEFTTDDRVPLASVSKPFAASVIMALAEQGKLDLEDPVEKYLPEFIGIRVKGSETPARPMTIRHVLSHMAGFWGNKGITPEKIGLIRDFSQTLEESVKGAAQHELISEPGTKWTYSGIGYCVAGRVAEAALGDQSFEKVAQDALFRPLGMNDTTFAPTPERPFILVGGSLRSTLDDMAVFGQMHLNDGEYNGRQYLSKASVTDQRRLQIPEERFRAPGLGWHRGFPDEDGQAGLLMISGATGPNFQVDRRRQTVTVFLVRSKLQNVLRIFDSLNQYVEKMFPIQKGR